MQAALDDQLSSEDALHFHFALGRAHEQRGEYRPSFDQYLAGNRVRSASLDPDWMRVTHLVDESIATFTKAMFERNAGGGAVEHDPIFVVGLQRSGSTLIEQILASHPDIEGTAELLTMPHRWDELVRRAAQKGLDPFELIAQLGARRIHPDRRAIFGAHAALPRSSAGHTSSTNCRLTGSISA